MKPLLCGLCLGVLLSGCFPQQNDDPTPASTETPFGSTQPAGPTTPTPRPSSGTLVNQRTLVGDLYLLEENTSRIDFANRTPVGRVYTSFWDIPTRDFSEGFPGVTDRFEWFGIQYSGECRISSAGEHTFWLESDDGSVLSIDDRVVIDNDGQHSTRKLEGKVTLTAGKHRFRLSYFQGPRTEIALRLTVRAPGSSGETVFECDR